MRVNLYVRYKIFKVQFPTKNANGTHNGESKKKIKKNTLRHSMKYYFLLPTIYREKLSEIFLSKCVLI